MKTLKTIKTLLLGIILAGVVLPSVARAGEWGPWRYVGDGVSVSFCRVQEHFEGNLPLWTWKFRNDGASVIKGIEFDYTEYRGGGYPGKANFDIMPVHLQPGHAFGGWGTFTAVSSIEPTIHIRSIDRN